MSAYAYPIILAVISLFVFTLERVFPGRVNQSWKRPNLLSDLAHIVFNGHFLGAAIATVYGLYIHQYLGFSLGFFADFPLITQILICLFFLDFLQWGIHLLLHKVPFLWVFHQVHHSVKDGEMDWIVAFRFHWMEVVLYKSFLYVPMIVCGFAPEAIWFHAIFGTLIGHLNHSNLHWDYGWGRYLFNNPRMHLWHHNYHATSSTTVNFGIIFSCWDWMFGQAHLPESAPAKIGFKGMETSPSNFISHLSWPLHKTAPVRVTAFIGTVLLTTMLWFAI